MRNTSKSVSRRLLLITILFSGSTPSFFLQSTQAQESPAHSEVFTEEKSSAEAIPLTATFPLTTIKSASSRDGEWFQLPSELPSGDAINDRIWFRWYAARGLNSQSGPAVILIHPLGRQKQSPMHKYARYLAAHGIASAVLTLPYHGRRLPAGEKSISRFVNPNTDQVVAALQQSVSDASTVIDWMSTQPRVDPERIGVVGISIGAIVTHLLMGQDARVKAGVAALGGGALAQTYLNSPLTRWKLLFRLFARSSRFGRVDSDGLKKLDAVDPVTFAGSNPPRRVLMIEAARDVVVPPQSAITLWEALGRPPIKWVDTNHFAAIDWASKSVSRASVAYLESVWNGKALAQSEIPTVHAPTIKAGFVMNLDSVVTPAVQYQFLALGTRDHRSLLSANGGMSARGPFLGLAATVTSYLDIGAARRLGGERIRPYASLHFVY